MCFERVLVVRDHIFSGGSQTFFTEQHARQFRGEIYKRFGEFFHESIGIQSNVKQLILQERRVVSLKSLFQDARNQLLFGNFWQIHNAGLPVPKELLPPKPPKHITFQRKAVNRRIINEAAFLALLQDYGEVAFL